MRTSWYHLCWGLLPWQFCPWARGPSDPGTNCLHRCPLLRFPHWHWSLGSSICSCVWVWSRAWGSGSVTWCVPLRQTIHSGFAEKTGRKAKAFRLSFYQMMGKKETKPKPEWNKVRKTKMIKEVNKNVLTLKVWMASWNVKPLIGIPFTSRISSPSDQIWELH